MVMEINPSIFVSGTSGVKIIAGKVVYAAAVKTQDLSPEKVAGNWKWWPEDYAPRMPKEERSLWGQVYKFDYFDDNPTGKANEEELAGHFRGNNDIDLDTFANVIYVKVYTDATKIQTTQAFRDLVGFMERLKEHDSLNDERAHELLMRQVAEQISVSDTGGKVLLNSDVVPQDWASIIAQEMDVDGSFINKDGSYDDDELWDRMNLHGWIDPGELYKREKHLADGAEAFRHAKNEDIQMLVDAINSSEKMAFQMEHNHPDMYEKYAPQIVKTIADLQNQLYRLVYNVPSENVPGQLHFLHPSDPDKLMSRKQMQEAKRRALRQKTEAAKRFVNELYTRMMDRPTVVDPEDWLALAMFSGKKVIRI